MYEIKLSNALICDNKMTCLFYAVCLLFVEHIAIDSKNVYVIINFIYACFFFLNRFATF